jgi:tetratricopeptide (TPR) repeat protein
MFPRQPTYIGFSGVIVIAFIWTSPVQAEENYVELWRHGRYTEALQAVEEASQSTTHFSLAQVRDQSELLFLTGRVDEAIEVRRAVTARQPLPSDLVRLAEYQRYRGRWEDGEQTLERVTEQVQLLLQYDSITEEEWLALGRLNELQGADAKLVLVHYRRLQEQQNSVEAHVAVGDLALATAAYDLAATEYAAALELDAQNQEALSGLLACFHESGERRSNSHHLPRSALSRAYQTQRRRRGSYRFYRQQRIGHHMGAEAAGIPLYADLTSHRKYGLRRHGERPGGC